MGSIRRKLGGGDGRGFKEGGRRGCAEGVVGTECWWVGGGRHVVGAGEVKSTEERGSEGTGKVEAKCLVGPVAGEGGVIGGAKVVVGWEGVFPGCIGGWEESLDGGGTDGVLVGSVGGRVGELGGCQWGEGGQG